MTRFCKVFDGSWQKKVVDYDSGGQVMVLSVYWVYIKEQMAM